MDNNQTWGGASVNPRPAAQGNPWMRNAPQNMQGIGAKNRFVAEQDTPVQLQGPSIPAQSVSIPSQGMNVPTQGMNIPTQGMGIPKHGTIPRQGMTIPAQSGSPMGSNPMNGMNTPFRGMSRADRLEAMRISMEARLNKQGFLGFQVVRREFISHSFDPAMTVRENSVTFNNACISKLEDAAYIQFLINPEEQKLIIRPCEEGDRDAVRWCITKQDKRKSRQITCRDFTERLYELMGWETVYRYKLLGVGINYQGEKMYLFDLQSKEAFAPPYKDPKTGKTVRPKAVLPEEWTDFGMTVEEHSLSTQVDLNAGYVEAGGVEYSQLVEITNGRSAAEKQDNGDTFLIANATGEVSVNE